MFSNKRNKIIYFCEPKKNASTCLFFFSSKSSKQVKEKIHVAGLSSYPTHNTCPSSFKVLSNTASTLAQTLSSVNGGCALYPQASALLHITDNYFYNKHQHKVANKELPLTLAAVEMQLWCPTFGKRQFPSWPMLPSTHPTLAHLRAHGLGGCLFSEKQLVSRPSCIPHPPEDYNHCFISML